MNQDHERERLLIPAGKSGYTRFMRSNRMAVSYAQGISSTLMPWCLAIGAWTLCERAFGSSVARGCSRPRSSACPDGATDHPRIRQGSSL